jgi:hypothetical protein
VKRLETLTATLLDISRLSTGKMVLELAEVDLGQLTRDAVASTLEQFPTSAELVTVRAQSVTRHWDAFRLEQVITAAPARAPPSPSGCRGAVPWTEAQPAAGASSSCVCAFCSR